MRMGSEVLLNRPVAAPPFIRLVREILGTFESPAQKHRVLQTGYGVCDLTENIFPTNFAPMRHNEAASSVLKPSQSFPPKLYRSVN